ncbi:hypothetical protein F5Y16DRAFT_399209 [Xylariaceae sp. FL0255]|nr:hypothetical protein F5Y16DRAFT_399209 [Xylariaceae sp. FL0255]
MSASNGDILADMANPPLASPPFASPPLGVIPDFEHAASKKPALIACLAAIGPIATLFVYLRVHAKAFGFALSVAVILGADEHNYEPHLLDIPQQYYADLITSGVFVGTTLLFVKLSLLFLVLRIFWVRHWTRYTTIAGIVIHVLVYTMATAFSIAGAYFRLTSDPSDINWEYPTLFILMYVSQSDLVSDAYLILSERHGQESHRLSSFLGAQKSVDVALKDIQPR